MGLSFFIKSNLRVLGLLRETYDALSNCEKFLKKSSFEARKEREKEKSLATLVVSVEIRMWRYVNDKWPCYVISFSTRGQESKWREQARKIQRNLFTVDTNSVYLRRAHVSQCILAYTELSASRFVDRLVDEENKLYTRAANSPTED